MEIINVMAVSVDGKIAAHPLENDKTRMSYGFSSEADKEFVREQINNADAIITGANSMRASDHAWEERGRDGRYPTWVVLSNSGLSEELGFWQQKHIPRWVVSENQLNFDFSKHGVQFLKADAGSIAKFTVQKLAEAGCKRVLLFGGGEINYLFYKENLVNKLKITVCPIIIASEGAPAFVLPRLPSHVQLHLLSSKAVENHVFLEYRILSN